MLKTYKKKIKSLSAQIVPLRFTVKQPMSEVFLSLGSNSGDRTQALLRAFALINGQVGKVVDFSSVYETEPWGYQSTNHYYNQVVKVASALPPLQLIKTLLQLEEKMGRVRTGQGYVDRLIDMDILFYNDQIIKNQYLIIPHPRVFERLFVLMPLCEIAPHFVHPVYRKTITCMLETTADKNAITLAIDKNTFNGLLLPQQA